MLANLKVARPCWRPPAASGQASWPCPSTSTATREITTLANLITLTPGTLSLDVSADRRMLYVHAMEVDDPEAFRREMKRGLRAAVTEIFQ